MPKKDTQFCMKWLDRLDCTKKPCSRWLKQGKSSGTFYCLVCNEEKSCKNGGWTDVSKHFQRPKHLQRLKDVNESGQLMNKTSFVQLNTNHERLFSHEDKVTRAETFWAMATAKLGLSYNSSQHIQELFTQMFSDSHIAKEFSMKPRKLSYILSHGTGRYFTKTMLEDLNKAPGYSLIFDDTVTIGVRKQLDLHFRYWCERKQRIVVRYYKSIFLGHATAEIQFRSMIDTLRADGVDLTKMLMLGRDNPNVNKAIEKLMDKEIRLEREKKAQSSIGLIHIGSCPLHLIHNSFKLAIDCSLWPVEEFLHNLALWFHRSPSRRDDYLKVVKHFSDDIGRFIRRFVITRWLEAGPIFDRVIDQWENLQEYFLSFIPSNDKISINTNRYDQIQTVFQTRLTLIRLKFLVFLYHNIYEQILSWFQQTQPLIHLLYDECEQLVRRLFSCFIHDDLIKQKTLIDFNSIDLGLRLNQKCDSSLEIGEATRHELCSLSSDEVEMFYIDIRTIYSTISKELLRTLPLNNDLLRHLKCLQPSMRHEESSHTSIMNIARTFPQILVPDEIDRISAEWYVYQNEKIPCEWVEKGNGYHPIDHYWRNVLTLKATSGAEKFLTLGKLIKCVLALSHSNADVERGFSENAFLLSDDRSLLSDASINGLRATRDAIKFFADGKTHEVPISKELLDSVRHAHLRYSIDLEKQNSTGKRKQDEENHISTEQELLYQSLSNVQKMIDEGTERLAKAISLKNFQEIETAQLLIEGGKKKLALINTQILFNQNQLHQLRKKLRQNDD